jgi:hypothetical protein
MIHPPGTRPKTPPRAQSNIFDSARPGPDVEQKFRLLENSRLNLVRSPSYATRRSWATRSSTEVLATVQGLGFPNPSVNRGSLSNGGGAGGLPVAAVAAEEEGPAESMSRLWKVGRRERERNGEWKRAGSVCQRAARFRKVQEAATR